MKKEVNSELLEACNFAIEELSEMSGAPFLFPPRDRILTKLKSAVAKTEKEEKCLLQKDLLQKDM